MVLAIAPRSLTVLLVVLGTMLISVGAVVAGHLAPQDLLLRTAMIAFIGCSVVADKVAGVVTAAAFAVIVLGNAWAFGAWASLDDVPWWPALLLAVVVGAVAVGLGWLLQGQRLRLAATLSPLSSAVAAAMVLSWFFARRGIVGVVLAGGFVLWAAIWLCLEVADARDDEGELQILRASHILDRGAEILWNALVFVVRLQPDDGDDTLLLLGAFG